MRLAAFGPLHTLPSSRWHPSLRLLRTRQRAVPHDTGGGLRVGARVGDWVWRDVRAAQPVLRQRARGRARVKLVVGPQQGLQHGGGLARMVVRHAREQVVRHLAPTWHHQLGSSINVGRGMMAASPARRWRIAEVCWTRLVYTRASKLYQTCTHQNLAAVVFVVLMLLRTHAARCLWLITKHSQAALVTTGGASTHSMWLDQGGRAAHVRVSNVVKEMVQEAVGAVHGAERAAQPGPLARRKVRQRRVPARWRHNSQPCRTKQ